jgi:phenylacetate-coenzyme A ligase PaaK-like adenylate-forming protein
VIELLVPQLRFAASMALGVRFSVRSLERLVEAIKETREEFGAVGDECKEFLGAPELDEESRREVQLRRFRTQAVRAARETRYYGALFERLGLDPRTLRWEDVQRLPLTPKDAIREDPDGFVRQGAKPCLLATTTGTTGRPTSVYFSEYEIRTIASLSALGILLQDQIGPEDIVQICSSSRGTLGTLSQAAGCGAAGALVYVVAVGGPEDTLALLTRQHDVPGKKPRTSVLFTYPSHLGEVVEYGLAHGYGPERFGLERAMVGGEVVTEGLKARAQRLFGPVQFTEGYAMSETYPCGGTCCSEGHLHFEVSQGLIEVHNPDTDAPARPGEIGTLVSTPFLPYRDTTLLLRYDTEDLVRVLDAPLTCELKHLPATSNILGKRRLSVHHEGGWTTPRDILEALEGADQVPLPARCGFWAVPGGVGVEVVTRTDSPGADAAIRGRLAKRGVPLRELRLVDEPAKLSHPFPLRGDLREAAFAVDGRRSGDPGAMT